MSYLEKVAARIDPVGIILLIVGAVLVYAAMPIVRLLKQESNEKAGIIIKAAGCVVALVGTLILLDLIG